MSWDSANAWNYTKAAIQSARDAGEHMTAKAPQFHKIRRADCESCDFEGTVIYIMAIPVTGEEPTTDTYYLCLQIDELSSSEHNWTPISDVKATMGTGRQLKVVYKVEGDERTGMVWLKK